jgi:tetratricopeptide (TPR) repeat protein
VSSESVEKLQRITVEYQAGKNAFERGQYRESVQHLARALALAGQNSRIGGEICIWLVTAYEAAGQRQEAIALCRQLKHHPTMETRKQSRQLLYILEAPRLNLRPEWLTQIPDLSGVSDDDPRYRRGGSTSSAPRPAQPTSTPEPIDLSQVNTRDNRFIWIALLAIALTLGGLVWFS